MVWWPSTTSIKQSSHQCCASQFWYKYLVSPSPIRKTLSSLLWAVLYRQPSQRDIIPKFCRSLEDTLLAFQLNKIQKFIVTFCKRCFKEYDVSGITWPDHQDTDFLVKIKKNLKRGKQGERLRKKKKNVGHVLVLNSLSMISLKMNLDVWNGWIKLKKSAKHVLGTL